MHVLGEVEGKDVVIIDDMIDTAGTLCSSADALAERGAKSILACATHGVFSANAIDRINESCLDKVIVTDSIYIDKKGKDYQKIEVLSIAGLIAEAIERIHEDRSVASLFLDAGAD
jgi:ribose-phosphate pyrophosphokinase